MGRSTGVNALGLDGNADEPKPTTVHPDELALIEGFGDDLVVDITGDRAEIRLQSKSALLDPTEPSVAARLIVRTFDLFASICGIALLIPVFVLVAGFVKAGSRGPIVFKSQRIGQDGQPFDLYKFRTMVLDAEAQLDALLAADPAIRKEYEEHHKLRKDPRVAPGGHLLRKTNLDEIPQLFNVLRGEMSLVGPRPKLLTERIRFGDTLPTVLRVKPGITGLWQVSGRSNLTFSERIFLDVEYATTRTVRGDLAICAKTAAQTFRPSKHGAY